MQKSNANETARDIIRTAKEILGEKIYNITQTSHLNKCLRTLKIQ